MQDPLAGRDRAFCHRPGKAVGIRLGERKARYVSIAVGGATTGPDPAVAGASDMVPKQVWVEAVHWGALSGRGNHRGKYERATSVGLTARYQRQPTLFVLSSQVVLPGLDAGTAYRIRYHIVRFA